MRSRNANSFFSQIPVMDIQQRSGFKIPFDHKTTFNQGMLVPLFTQEVLPADTVRMKKSYVLRMQPTTVPVMDDLWFDTFWFFVPNRLVWNHWQNFMGQNDDSPWVNDTQYSVPVMPGTPSEPDVTAVNIHSLNDYFGLPSDPRVWSGSYRPSALAYRAYRKIWNDWFRSEVTDNPLPLNLGDTESDMSLYDVLYADRYHDYFSSCTPAPQRGDSVLIPIGGTPVVATGDVHQLGDKLRFNSVSGSNTIGITSGEATLFSNPSVSSPLTAITQSNLVVGDSSGTINDLRLAFAMQSLFERDARGSRYIEYLKLAFGVTIPDATLQRSQYLGGKHQRVDMSQVIQTSSATAESPQGNVTGFSKTVSVDMDFENTFLEHGWLFCLGVVRQQRTYQQGLNRQFSRFSRFDFYDPIFAHLGNQPVYTREIFMNVKDPNSYNNVFGYQEAWSDYKYKQSYVSGMFRKEYADSGVLHQGIQDYHYADWYTEAPTLSESWMKETPDNGAVKRTVAVTNLDQFYIDIFFDADWKRKMPLYCIPGFNRTF